MGQILRDAYQFSLTSSGAATAMFLLAVGAIFAVMVVAINVCHAIAAIGRRR